jgi:hypothetical protein
VAKGGADRRVYHHVTSAEGNFLLSSQFEYARQHPKLFKHLDFLCFEMFTKD